MFTIPPIAEWTRLAFIGAGGQPTVSDERIIHSSSSPFPYYVLVSLCNFVIKNQRPKAHRTSFTVSPLRSKIIFFLLIRVLTKFIFKSLSVCPFAVSTHCSHVWGARGAWHDDEETDITGGLLLAV